ncbi:FAD/NAD(P)-binding oxidoreductase [Sphingomonas oleivorans]|uniref:FAD/NAD(P)-binding oxidoreductase n=1 Tax=Sphingomonas oleivorans TaxID=1735121 RepID=A0A2T5FZJ9_9SPHN|nr:NAD(P)/FAD-dependent oxidoreductase [Sphingomonas oleivorans]PTQ12132.1 FAD/NAD(P)-binding oxidoreductase [Sphingomonas oleivorans]
MADPRMIIVGAGPAGMRAAEALAAAGIRPTVIDEGQLSGGQIYRRQPVNFTRRYEALYGADAKKARALHKAFNALQGRIDYRPETLAWNLRDDVLHIVTDGVAAALRFDALILATGATDRLAPIAGWTLPGCYSLGGAQIALKAQACSIGARPLFLGTGPLLYLLAYQYLKAGAPPAAVLDTAPFAAQVKALPDLAVRPGFLARGLMFRARLRAAGILIENGVEPLAIEGEGKVAAVRYRTAGGTERRIACDAVGMGFHLRSETQLADLAGCPFLFDAATGQWRPDADRDGRTPRAGIYVAGDGARLLGADAAEAAGRLAALAALTDRGMEVDMAEVARLRRRMERLDRFRRGLATAFPWPARLACAVADEVIVCRCEAITAGNIREAAVGKDAPELNRAKALSRIGMGRCQGRFCSSAAAEILAEARNVPLAEVGRLRGQAPIKPLSMATVKGERP